MESVFVKQPIQNKYVPHRQRSSHTSWWRIVEVGVLDYKLTSPVNSIADSDWNVSGDKLADWVHDVYRGRRVKRLKCHQQAAHSLAYQPGECSMRDGLHRRPYRDPGRHFQDNWW